METVKKNFSKTSVLLLFWFAFGQQTKAQIVSGNCYVLTLVGGVKLDYNPAINANYVYGRNATNDTKTSSFKFETAPAPNTSFYTIKTYDGKYLTRENSTNKIKAKTTFDEVDNQLFSISVNSNGLFISSKNTLFGSSGMQWTNNEMAYVW